MRRALKAGILAVSLTLAAAPAHAAASNFWGVVLRPPSATQQDLTLLHNAHVGTARIVLLRHDIEVAPGVYHWNGPDQVIGALATRGIPVMPDILDSASNPNSPPVHSAGARSAFKAFLRAAVKRYGPGGDFWSGKPKKLPIRAWQIYNEPNLPSMFQSNNPVRDYARLLAISHQAIRSADAHAKVVLAGLPGFAKFRGWRFLDRLYRVNGAKRHFEIGAPHPYAPSQHYVAVQINRYRHVMKKHHDARTPIWFTEFGWGSGHPDGDINKGLHGQARNLKRSFRMFWHNRHRWHLQRVFWFEFRDPVTATNQCPFCDTSGLLKKNYDKKPSYNAYRRFAGSH